MGDVGGSYGTSEANEWALVHYIQTDGYQKDCSFYFRSYYKNVPIMPMIFTLALTFVFLQTI